MALGMAVLAVTKIRISRRPSSLQPLLMRGNDLITPARRDGCVAAPDPSPAGGNADARHIERERRSG